MTTEPALLVGLDLAGTFTYAVNGGLTAVRAARLDIVRVVTLAMVGGLGGGIIRDILLSALPPATFSDWRYLAVAAAGGHPAPVRRGDHGHRGPRRELRAARRGRRRARVLPHPGPRRRLRPERPDGAGPAPTG